ncbi:hypothetical protein OJO68_22780 [Escherichia coli]|nr:hypothetical protein [Escherichia coli]MCW3190259.1 hypothetical protein [Escherichia coli]
MPIIADAWDCLLNRLKNGGLSQFRRMKKKLTENIRTDRALRDAKNKFRELEKELKRKDKALAEAAALLILREKFNALWDNSEEDCPLSWSGIKLFLLSVRPSPTAPGKVRLVGVSRATS